MRDEVVDLGQDDLLDITGADACLHHCGRINIDL